MASLIKRLENKFYFLSGGLSNVSLFKELLSSHLYSEIYTDKNAIYCGAMGAAIIAKRKQYEIWFHWTKKEEFSSTTRLKS